MSDISDVVSASAGQVGQRMPEVNAVIGHVSRTHWQPGLYVKLPLLPQILNNGVPRDYHVWRFQKGVITTGVVSDVIPPKAERVMVYESNGSETRWRVAPYGAVGIRWPKDGWPPFYCLNNGKTVRDV